MLYYFYQSEWIFVVLQATIKISILLFYLRIFPDKRFKRWVFGIIGLNVAFCIAFVLPLVFQCDPVPGAWLRWDGTFTGTCLNLNAIGWSGAAANVALDIAVLLLPVPNLLKLNVNWRKKVAIMSMFLVGIV